MIVIFHLDGYIQHREGFESILRYKFEDGVDYELRSFAELKEFSYSFVDEGCRADIYVLGEEIIGDDGYESSISAIRIIRAICPDAKILALVNKQKVKIQLERIGVIVLDYRLVNTQTLIEKILSMSNS